MRRAALLAGLLALTLAGACVRDKGAVLVRWKLVDSSTGKEPSGCSDAVATGKALDGERAAVGEDVCCAGVKSERLGSTDVIIDHIRLRAQRIDTDPDAGQEKVTDVDCPSCCAPCSRLRFEHTTEFELPPGEYKLWIEPLRCGVPVGATPPAVVRTVTAGEITNLNAIEVRLDSETRSLLTCPFDGGVSRSCCGTEGCGDGGVANPASGSDGGEDLAAPVPDGG